MTHADIVDALSRTPALRPLDDQVLNRLAAKADFRRVPARTRIIDEGEASEDAYVLSQGVAGAFVAAHTGGLMVKLITAPDLFGVVELLSGSARAWSVDALDATTLVQLPGAELLDALRNNQAACFMALEGFARDVSAAGDDARSLCFDRAETRLAALFVKLLRSYGLEQTGGKLPLQLPYSSLARCLGVTQRSVERTMAAWLREGWLTNHRGRYVFNDTATLLRRAPKPRRQGADTDPGRSISGAA